MDKSIVPPFFDSRCIANLCVASLIYCSNPSFQRLVSVTIDRQICPNKFVAFVQLGYLKIFRFFPILLYNSSFVTAYYSHDLLAAFSQKPLYFRTGICGQHHPACTNGRSRFCAACACQECGSFLDHPVRVGPIHA